MLILCVSLPLIEYFALYYASCGMSLIIGYILHLSTTESSTIQNIQQNVQNLPAQAKQPRGLQRLGSARC